MPTLERVNEGIRNDCSFISKIISTHIHAIYDVVVNNKRIFSDHIDDIDMYYKQRMVEITNENIDISLRKVQYSNVGCMYDLIGELLILLYIKRIFETSDMEFSNDKLIIEGKLITKTREMIQVVEELLLAKNTKYGNSVFTNMQIFTRSTLTFIDKIHVRIEDKLSRIIAGFASEVDTGSATDEDTIMDLIGYLHILRIAYLIEKEEPMEIPF